MTAGAGVIRKPAQLNQVKATYSAKPYYRSPKFSVAPHFAVRFTLAEIGKRAFHVSAPTVWKRLPGGVRPSVSLSIFKRRLKKTLSILSSACYALLT